MFGCFGHCVFLFLHFLAVLFGFVGLLLTVPLHLIFAVMVSRR
jgi:predicted PurR-regulated permease PerM